PDQLVGSDYTNHAVTATVSGLLPGVRYDVRLVTGNPFGTTTGPNLPFATQTGSKPPPPVQGSTVNLAPVSGRVYIEVPGSRQFVKLTAAIKVRVGSSVDTTHGKVALSSARSVEHHRTKTQPADFYDGEFQVGQRHGHAETTLTLKAGASCSRHAADSAATASPALGKPSHKSRRKLWGSGHGVFTTRGQYASAAVLGTVWLTQDFCDGTLVHVTRDKVTVDDFVRHKKFVLRAPHSYFARA